MKKQIINLKNNFKTETLKTCSYCGYPYKTNKLLKCSYKGCKIQSCFNCMTFINNKPFCHECLLKIMKHDVSIIILKTDNL